MCLFHGQHQIFASDSFLQLTEYSREEILGRNCRVVLLIDYTFSLARSCASKFQLLVGSQVWYNPPPLSFCTFRLL
jgi:PAS domain-containing protein